MEHQIIKCCKTVDLGDCYHVEIQCSRDLQKIHRKVYIAFCDDHIKFEDEFVKYINKKLSSPDSITIDIRE